MTYSAEGIAGGGQPRPAVRAPTQGIVFACQPSRVDNALQFSFSVTNGSPSDIYVLEALPSIDPGTKQATVNLGAAYIAVTGSGEALLMKGIPPLPPRPVSVRIMPFGAKVAAGATLERSFSVPLPLAEQSPYYADLPLRQYEQASVNEIAVAIQFISGTAEGFAAVPVDFAPHLYRVQTRQTVQHAETLTCRFPVKNMLVLRRTDDFRRMAVP